LNINAAGAATYSATPSLANDLTISLVAGNYLFDEDAESINVTGPGAAGCTGSGTGLVTCPDAGINSIAVDAGDMNDTVTIQSLGDPATVAGGLGDDTLDASTAMSALTLDGGAGNDVMTGGDGNDRMSGGTGNDALAGGAGNDFMSAGVGNDTVDGDGGTDTIVEGADTDFILSDSSLGGLGVDSLAEIEQANLAGGLGNNTIDAWAFSGSTTLFGLAGNDSLAGGLGVDSLVGGAGNDTLAGSLSNDILIGSVGNDTLDGGGGNDTVDFGGSPNAVHVTLKNGNAKGDGRDRLSAIETVFGSAFNDVLLGNDLSNVLFGGAGNDRISGLGGDDILGGGLGLDRLLGGLGNDILLGGAQDDLLVGHAGRDVLIGGANNDFLNATPGDDILIPGTTDHDGDNAALAAILAEWTSDRDYTTRTNNLRDGSGSVDRVNGATFLSLVTVHEDDASDRLTGSADTDWFFACTVGPKKDDLTDQVLPELIEQLCAAVKG
jgi:Ca2+-binding RTX toxin-like protein